jgi:hypothetical protein
MLGFHQYEFEIFVLRGLREKGTVSSKNAKTLRNYRLSSVIRPRGSFPTELLRPLAGHRPFEPPCSPSYCSRGMTSWQSSIPTEVVNPHPPCARTITLCTDDITFQQHLGTMGDRPHTGFLCLRVPNPRHDSHGSERADQLIRFKKSATSPTAGPCQPMVSVPPNMASLL